MKTNIFWRCLCLGAGLLLAACPNPVEEHTPETPEDIPGELEDWQGLRILKEDGSSALEGDLVIWKDSISEPYLITLTVEGEDWENITWYLSSAESPAGTGPSITIDARVLRESQHRLTCTGFRQGIPYSASIPFTVRAVQAADISWMETEHNSSIMEFDPASWTGYGELIETWKLRATESSRAHFAVHKRVTQTITIEGAHQDKVSKAALGEEVDGSLATEDLDIFTVDTGDVETLFQGGERSFTLRVLEPGKDAKLVLVHLEVLPYLTGATIFAVNPQGGLERITGENALDHANDLYRQHQESAEGFPSWGIDIADITGLAGALKWLDSYAQSGTGPADLREYLVRVEKNEVLGKTALTGYGPGGLLASYVKVRLRGYGAERRITHDSTEIPGQGYYKGDTFITTTATPGFIAIGYAYGNSYITLQLEENITIDAAGGTDPHFPDTYYMTRIVSVANNCTFVMEPGSKLTNGMSVYPVGIEWNGAFVMNGGEISHCKKNQYAVRRSSNTNSTFTYNDGLFLDNDSNYVYTAGATEESYACPDTMREF